MTQLLQGPVLKALRRAESSLVAATVIMLALSSCGAPQDAAQQQSTAGGTESGTAAGVTAAEDGYIAIGETVSPFDGTSPVVAKLEQGLRAALQDAATAASHDGIDMFITSGWRSARYQQSLLDEAIREYGSEEEARKWVNTPEKSTHVTGDAVDVAYTDADSWLSQHGADYGLCQTYANEIWHFELAVEPGGTCPEQKNDATTG